jgi:hypothetical protein
MTGTFMSERRMCFPVFTALTFRGETSRVVQHCWYEFYSSSSTGYIFNNKKLYGKKSSKQRGDKKIQRTGGRSERVHVSHLW